ncbi:UNVERIFIED_CONTAM: hypothetical protein PYX00_008763 [Menopon gallinae]|uniref:Cubilin n=1 Tax=Menopon gallinae TaxID=328185 RepID=A0AAW2HPL9_9NEOP
MYFSFRPRLQTVDGHLFIYGGQDKNLTLLTTNKGYVNVNGEDLFSIVQNAKIAFGLIKNLKYTALNKLEDDMKGIALNLEQFSQRLNACETALTSFRSKDKGYFPAVVLLRSRVAKIERRVGRISRNLLRNECRRDPCLNGGTCLDRYLGYECRCPEGWEGKKCEKDVNECAKFAGTDLGCQNGATCINTRGSYECHCAPGWHGLHCLRRSNDCNSGSAAELCGHGICVSQSNDPRGYTCICSQGWKTDGVSLACTVDVDECATSPCSRNPPVSCHNAPGTFFCGPCPSGYTGNGFQCTDVDECLVENGGCSVQPMVPCINTFGSSICGSCPPGYSGDGRTCLFVGKCQVDNGGCHAKAQCTEIGSNVQCRCLPGYTGYGIGPFGCREVSAPISEDPCEPNPCKFGGRCYKLFDKSFGCTCMPGFTGVTCDIINSCDSNPCLNGGTCEPSGDTFRCKCRMQFTGQFCEDRIEECGGYLTGEGGVVKFPPANSSSTGTVNCAWVIQVDVTRVINITFHRFELQTSFECQLEWVEIHDGRSVGGVTIGRYCGGNPPRNSSIVTTQSYAYVILAATEQAEKPKFEFSWNAIDPVCGGAVNSSVHGVITSPGYPGNYPNNRDCYWEVMAPVGKRIMFTIFELRLKSDGSCSTDFLEIHEDMTVDSPLLGKFCNTSAPEIIETPGNTAYLFFHSDSKDADKGFQIAYHPQPGHPGCGGIFTSLRGEIVPPTRNDKYLPNMDCAWVIRLPEERRIKVEFVKFSLQNSRNCRDDFLELRDGGDITSPLLGKYCGSVLPPAVSSNHRTMYIRFYADEVIERAGFQIQYKSVCDETFTSASGVIKSPGYPNTYKNEEECVFIIEQPVGKIINLEFQEFEIESTYRCIFDYVEIRDGHDSTSPLIGRYCGSNRPGRIVSTHNYLYLKMVTDNNVELAGFYGNYSAVDVSCGGIHTAPWGVITSPVEEGRYPSNSYCRWVIAVQQGRLIQLTFNKFKVEGFKDCVFDYVAVYDNSTDLKGNNLIGRYCNYDLPPVLTSSSNVLTIVFKSDSSFTDEGFQITYTTINGSSSCGGKFFTEWGVIKSPNYPNLYPNGIACSWVIHVKNGHKISLNITDFDLERPFVFEEKKCKFDYLEIRDGGYVSSPLIGRFCGSNIPRQILSQSNNLYLEFGSDNLDSGRGFQIFWDGSIKGCGGTLTGPAGSIISPNYPENYGSIVNCVYRISVSHGSKIQISFIDLELEAAAGCKKESIEIFDGIDFQSKSLGKFCTLFSVPSSIQSSGNHLTVRFKSGLRSAGKGYYLKYFTACRTNVTGYRGVIESPNFPSNFPTSLDCLWSIKAPLGNKIALKFTNFNFRASCRNTFIEVSSSFCT